MANEYPDRNAAPSIVQQADKEQPEYYARQNRQVAIPRKFLPWTISAAVLVILSPVLFNLVFFLIAVITNH